MFEVYESKKYIHLLLPYLDGGELFERIKSKGLYKESDAVPVMNNLFQALHYLAEKRVVHRDLKPENLILRSKLNDHDLLIADFGLASFLEDDETLLKERCGSPGYVAPELLADDGYNCAADVFSAGVIMYVLLTGRLVFRGNNLNQILLKNKNCEFDYPEKYWNDISFEAKDLVSRLLTKDPADRWTAKQALTHSWFKKYQEQQHEIEKEPERKREFEDQSHLLKDGCTSLVTKTPVMGGRIKNDCAPVSPWLTSKAGKRDQTPVMPNISLRAQDEFTKVQKGPVVINMPKYLLDRKNAQNGGGEKMKMTLPGRRALQGSGPSQQKEEVNPDASLKTSNDTFSKL